MVGIPRGRTEYTFEGKLQPEPPMSSTLFLEIEIEEIIEEVELVQTYLLYSNIFLE